jgi:hypothetical protein
MSGTIKWLFALALVAVLGACEGPTADLKDPPVDLGNFKLGHNIVVARNPQLVPGSRTATEAEWQAAMTKAIADRFGRYDGSKFYHLGISVDAYNLAAIDVPGVPTPKSALGVTATVWDDAAGKKLNEKAKTLTVLGVFSGAGIQPTREVQLNNLSELMAKAIQNWLLEHPEWFASDEAAPPPG